VLRHVKGPRTRLRDCDRTAVRAHKHRRTYRLRPLARRDDRVRTNERIRVREVRVIDETGQQLGIMPPPQALAIARQKGLDLVEISPTAVPPVCRIMDFRQVPVPGTEAISRSQEAPARDRGQGDQVPAEGGRARLPVQEEAHRAVPERRRQGQGDDLLPRPRDGAPGDRAPHPRAADRELGDWPRPKRCRARKATRCTSS
jgi:hypothetical protein